MIGFNEILESKGSFEQLEVNGSSYVGIDRNRLKLHFSKKRFRCQKFFGTMERENSCGYQAFDM